MLRIRWHGHSCFEITNEQTIVTDPHDGTSIGLNAPDVKGDVILVSHDHYDHNSVKSVINKESIIIKDKTVETVFGIDIKGFRSFHDEDGGRKRGNNLIFSFYMSDICFCHLGDLGHVLDETTVQLIGEVDVLFVPVGGNFTINGEQAWEIIRDLKPRVIVPMHYKIEGLSLSIEGIDFFLEKNKINVINVGNEMNLEKEDLPDKSEIWVFTL